MSELAVYDCMLFFMRAARPERVRETFELVEQGLVTYCLSSEVLGEIKDVLTRPRHQRDFPQLTPVRVEAFLANLTARCRFVQDVPEQYVLERDPKDSKYINLALAAGAPCLVTRDKDLLELAQGTPVGLDFRARFPQLQIVEPATFVGRFRGPRTSPG